jgi:transcriptional regulator with XRE-family HTH domain
MRPVAYDLLTPGDDPETPMASPRRSPTLRRRRLSAELRRLREANDLTGVAVEERFGWSPGKVSRMERGFWVRPNLRDVQDLLDLFKVTDEDERDKLMTLARDARLRGWWHAYKDMVSDRYSTYIGLEAEAVSINTFQLSVIPGLLQTPDYARATLASPHAKFSADEIDKRLEIRMARQELLTGEDPIRLFAVMDEAVFRRPIGGPDVMRSQLQHLIEIAERPEVTLQVIPFAAGMHAGVTGSFSILEFPEPDDQDAVYVEALAGELFMEDPEEVRPYAVAFQHLNAVAASPRDTISMIAALAEA